MKKDLKSINLDFLSTDVSVSVKIESEVGSPPPPDKFETSIARDFKIPDGIEKDAASDGFKLSELRTYKNNKIQKEPFYTFKFPWGHVYSWSTPTRGAKTYSYICRTQDSYCFKIGPYQNLYWDFNWNSLSFSKLNQK